MCKRLTTTAASAPHYITNISAPATESHTIMMCCCTCACVHRVLRQLTDNDVNATLINYCISHLVFQMRTRLHVLSTPTHERERTNFDGGKAPVRELYVILCAYMFGDRDASCEAHSGQQYGNTHTHTQHGR